MFIWLKDEKGESHKVEVGEVKFNCNNMTLPILPNICESNEETLVQIWYIINEYVKFLDSKIESVKIFSKLPNCVVEKLNLQSVLLCNYLYCSGVSIFIPNCCEFLHSSPLEKTPNCQYMYDSCKSVLAKIEKKFEGLGLKFDNREDQEGYW